MTLYRIHRNVNIKGRVVQGSSKNPPVDPLVGISAKGIAALLAREVITVARLPKLETIPGWKPRARRLMTIGVITVADYMTADLSKLARAMNTSTSVASRYRNDLRREFMPEHEKSG